MTLVLHTCPICHSQYSSPLAASYCCDPDDPNERR